MQKNNSPSGFKVVIKGRPKIKPKNKYDHERDKEMIEMMYGGRYDNVKSYERAKRGNQDEKATN